MSFGMNIIESDNCVKRMQFRFPHSKKRRVRAKWSNRETNYKYLPRAFQASENTIYCHPSIAAKLRNEIPLR